MLDYSDKLFDIMRIVRTNYYLTLRKCCEIALLNQILKDET